MSIQQIIAESNVRFEQTLAKFDQSLARSAAEQAQTLAKALAKFDQSLSEFKLLRAEDNARFEKNIHDAMYKIIGILSGIVILTGAVASLLHHLI